MSWRRLLGVCVVGVAVGACDARPQSDGAAGAATGLRYLCGGNAEGFERALGPRNFEFPADHGPHTTFRTEWWYFTGNVVTSEGRHFGFELTFFRYALPQASASSDFSPRSRWRTNQFWMAHLAITDTAAKKFVAAERFARESLGVAGATATPLRVWVEDWSAAQASGSGFSAELIAGDEAAGIELELKVTSDAAPVLQGDRGFDRKGPSEGNASYYYSLPRLAVAGAIRVSGEEFGVEGLAWLDREWSTSALEGDVIGWDWFALRLSDGSSLMFYRLRQEDGGGSPFSGGKFVDRDGRETRLEATEVELSPEREWHSEATGVRYPVAWALRVPRLGLSLAIEPRVDGQELALTVRYWEGAVFGRGTGRDGPLEVEGYLELAGY
jgi:predicted secreted hydrolase